ncbi:hypothetical protein Tco_0877533 [Tanacetum coccineum]|uniref:Uncharacterized protein n=1 Tax=Tanacetum coccineum TaxID=301880 RepID=A0ABQ5BYB5_9ASTR
MTSPEMRETKAYKTYFSYATGATPPKKARKFKKVASPSKKLSPVLEEEPAKKLKRVKRPAKKSTIASRAGVVIRDTHVVSLSKKKEKVYVDQGKGIELLSEVSLTEEAQMKEVRKKSMRDFYRTHPSGSGKVSKIPPSAEKIKPSITNEGTSAKPGVPDVTEEESTERSDSEHETDENETGFESDQQENEEVKDDDEEKDKFVNSPSIYTPTDDEDETNVESKDDDNAEDFASVFQFNNKVSALKKDVAELKKNEPLNTQVISLVDEHLDSRLGATKDEFMSYLSESITARITKQVKIQLPLILPKKVSNFAPLVIKIIVTESLEHVALAKESSQPQSTQSYLTAAEHRECYDGLIKSYDLDKSLFSTYDKVYSLKRSQKYKDKNEDPSVGSDRRLKKRKTSKDAEPTKGPKAKESQSGSSKGTKSQSKSSGKSIHAEEPEFEVADSDML